MSPVTGNYAGTHFSEIVAKKLGYELIAYSRGGMSNLGIAIQVHTALNHDPKPDLIFVGTTFFDRMEWPFNEVREIKDISVKDIVYSHPTNSLSCSYDWLNIDPKIVSTSLIDIYGGWYNNTYSKSHEIYLEERKKAMEQYFEYIYHPDLKRFLDEQVIYSMYHKLHESGIPYIICIEQLRNIVDSCKWLNFGINSYNYARNDIDEIIVRTSYGDPPPFKDPGYHCNPIGQIEIADLLIEKYLPNL